MKLREAMKLLDENPDMVFEADTPIDGICVIMTNGIGYYSTYKFEIFKYIGGVKVPLSYENFYGTIWSKLDWKRYMASGGLEDDI